MSFLRAFLPFVMLVIVTANRPDPYDICALPCVINLYDDFCGGTNCVYGPSNEVELAYLCSESCIDALNGPSMFSCLKKKDPERTDFDLVVEDKLGEIKSKRLHKLFL